LKIRLTLVLMSKYYKLNKKHLPIVNRRNPHPLKNCLDNFKKSCGDLEKLTKINENWKNLIGLELFQECKPINIEKKILTIAVYHPQWRQALIYNKHKLKERIEKIGITLNEIKIIQNYEIKNKNINEEAIIESLISFKRSGASAIVTYFAIDIAKKLNKAI